MLILNANFFVLERVALSWIHPLTTAAEAAFARHNAFGGGGEAECAQHALNLKLKSKSDRPQQGLQPENGLQGNSLQPIFCRPLVIQRRRRPSARLPGRA
jgi:hypothetical protein